MTKRSAWIVLARDSIISGVQQHILLEQAWTLLLVNLVGVFVTFVTRRPLRIAASVSRCIGIGCIPKGTNSLHYAAAVTCVIFSSVAVASPDHEGGNRGGPSKPAPKAAVKNLAGACNAPDASKGTSASRNRTNAPDRSCLVSLSAIDKLRTKKDFSLVDVRTPAEYDRYRIADSINIPLHLFKTKKFLKKSSVVLINDGRSTIGLEKTCGELRQAGFERVTVLEGGLFAWHADNRALEGNPAEQSRLNRLSAEELFEERTMSNWSVIDISTPGRSKDMRPWLPAKSTAIPVKSKGDLVGRITSAISQQRKRNPQARLLLIADDNDAYERIDARLRKSGGSAGLLRLEGGVKGYRQHVAKQVAIWDQQQQPRSYQACRG